VTKLTTTVLLALAISAAAQTGTRPDPVAGQPSTMPGGTPTNTPQAQQQASPAQKPAATDSAPAPTQPPDTQPPAPAAASAPAQPQGEPAPNVAHVELTPPVTGAPTTKIFDPWAVGKHTGVTGAADPLLDVPPLPKGKPTLIGGTAVKVDRIHSRVTVEPFGAKNKMSIYIDERSHIYRNGVETTIMGVKKGDRVYFDTMLDGANVFAKNVRVFSETGGAEVRGQVTAYDAARGTIQLQDALSSRPVSFRISNDTRFRTQQGSASASDLARGALVDVVFAPDKANRGIASEITLLARPGTSYTFVGLVTNLNLRDGVVSVATQADGKVYDIQFDPRSRTERSGLHVGNSVSVNATFDGQNYHATSVTATQTSATPQPSKPKPDDDQE
jgi:hypothetical protein